MAQEIQEGWLGVKLDEEHDCVVIQTPKGDFIMSVRDFSIFCKKAEAIACWARNIKNLKEFIKQIMEKKRRDRPSIENGDEILAVQEAEKITAGKRNGG